MGSQSLHLLYHEICPAAGSYTYAVALDEFREHCALFQELRDLDLPQDFRPEITFDDGHASDHHFAAPVLAASGLKAHFFITAGWTGQRPGFMSWSELRALHGAGHAIGAHGMTHALLTACSPRELQRELDGAKARLEDGLGAPVTTMSLPGGRSNATVLRACHEAGFHQVFTSVPQAVRLESAPARIGRLNLLAGTRAKWLRQVLDERSGVLPRLQRRHKGKLAAQRVLGDRLYAALWAVVNRKEAAVAAGTVAP